MGKNKKEHRKRVEARNNQLKGLEKTYQKMYQVYFLLYHFVSV